MTATGKKERKLNHDKDISKQRLKRASSDDTLAKPGLGSALATSRMRKTVTIGAISELAEARPRGIPGYKQKYWTSKSDGQSKLAL
ncbi:UNVERIFIED_CONTAM: hypothetical protein FKN15_064653 [Acipenser sinensis]